MSRIVRKPTKWYMREVSTRFSPCRRNPGARHFPLSREIVFQESLLYTLSLIGGEMLGRIRLRVLRKVILVDTLRRCHIVGFLVMRLICKVSSESIKRLQWY